MDLPLSLEVPLPKLIVAVLALATAVIGASVQAQIYGSGYPVCLHVYGDQEGERMDCIYTSMPQCRAAASGRSATCEINPYAVRAPSPRRR